MFDLATLQSIIPGILGILGLGGAAGQRWIEEGDRALVKRFGKALRVKKGPNAGHYRVLGPGFNLIIPGVDKLAKTHVRERVINFGDEEITLKDTTVFTVDGVLIGMVGDSDENLYKALFEVNDLDKAIRLYCISVLREVVRELTYKQLIGGDTEDIGRKLKERVQDQLADWGFIVKSFNLGDLAPYGETLRMIQTPAAAEMRADAAVAVAAKLADVRGDTGLLAAAIGIPVSVTVNEPRDTSSSGR